MNENRTRHRARVTAMFLAVFLATSALCGRLAYLMIFRSEYYSGKAEDLHQRERTIKAARGRIIDRNGTVIADNRTVCTVSVIHNQVEEPEPHTPASTPEVVFGMDQEILTRDLFPLEEDSFEVRLPFE